MKYRPNFDIDLSWGERGEEVVSDILNMEQARLEVKRPRTGYQRIFVEIQQRPRGSNTYIDSGLRVTEADFMAYTFGSAVMIWPTSVVRHAVDMQQGQPVDAGLNGDNPTRGFWLPSHYLTQIAFEWGVE